MADAMARQSALFATVLLIFICGTHPIWSLKCRADDEVANEADYRDAVRVCMSNLTSERDEQGYRPDDSGGGNSGSGGGNRRQRPKGDSNGGGGNRRPGRPYRPGAKSRKGRSEFSCSGMCDELMEGGLTIYKCYGGFCDSGSYGGNRDGDRYGNNGGYGGNGGGNYGNNGGYGGSNSGYGGNSGGAGYGGSYYGYGGGPPQHRRPMPGGTVMQGGPMGGGPLTGVPLAGRPRTRRSSGGYTGSHDGRIGTALDNVDACIVHCIFRQMQMLNENARPDKEAIIGVMTQRVRDRELRDFILESVDECFEYSKSESIRSLNKCDFSKKLALCLEEKAKRHCDDWDEDGNSRGDQRGDRDRGSNSQRPPRQHYVGR